MPKTGMLPLKWHGGKAYLASRIWDVASPILPSVIHCVETHCGGCSWTLEGLARGYKKSFMINDIDRLLVNFWRVLRDDAAFDRFRRMVEATPLARDEWNLAGTRAGSGVVSDIERAHAFFVRCRQSLAGRRNSFTPPTRTRLRRGMNGNVSEWLGAVDGLPKVHSLLRRVFVENLDANILIPREDGLQTLFYCDPPYLHETRASTDVYAHEMSRKQHIQMLRTLLSCKGKVMLSGYPSELYDHELAVWNRHTWELPNNAAGGKGKRRKTEVVWTNF